MPDPGPVIDAWLEEGPRELQYPVREAIRLATQAIPQRQAWSVRLFGRRAVLVASLAAAAAMATLVLMSLVGRPDTPAATPTPSATSVEEASNFANGSAPFTYVVPPSSGIETSDTSWDFYQFVGPDGDQFVRVRLITEGFTDPCDPDAASPTVALTSPGAVATYLMSTPELHAQVGQTVEVDGRPAIVIDTRVVRDAACPEVFLWPAAIPVRAPADGQSLRFLLTEVNGSVVAVAIQAGDLEQWLPTAMALVESIHFEAPAP